MNEFSAKVYTIGAYEEAFARNQKVKKLGPLLVAEIPSAFPASFLEKDGSYGGGEVFDSIEKALAVLEQKLLAEVLPKTENWHIYLLEADWSSDIYELHPNDFRVKHTVDVLHRVDEPKANPGFSRK